MTVNEKGYAKLNYSLDVHARRPDGYHDLTMVMGSVSLWDDVDVTLRRDGRIEAKCSIPWLPRDERNLAVRAARVFFDAAGDKTLGADIRIKKRLPVGAGLAGGSAEIGSIRGALLDGGALGAVMTGTGSAVFGVFDDRAAAAAAYESLSQSYRECFLVRAADALTL